MILECPVPLRLVSESNMREHWAAKFDRVARQRATVTMVLNNYFGPKFGRGALEGFVSVRISLTRIAPRRFDAHDNLRASFKAVADAIASWLCVQDNDPRLSFEYAQEKGLPLQYAVRIRIEAKPR